MRVAAVRAAVAGLSAAGRAGATAVFGTGGRLSVAVCRRRKHTVSRGQLHSDSLSVAKQTHHNQTKTFQPKIC